MAVQIDWIVCIWRVVSLESDERQRPLVTIANAQAITEAAVCSLRRCYLGLRKEKDVQRKTGHVGMGIGRGCVVARRCIFQVRGTERQRCYTGTCDWRYTRRQWVTGLFAFAILPAPVPVYLTLLIPPAHYRNPPPPVSHRHRQKISPRPASRANATPARKRHQGQDHRDFPAISTRDLSASGLHQVVPSSAPAGVRADFPLDEIVCVSKFSIASARSTVTRTSTTPLAKRPPRHLPHNPLLPKWTLPSELRRTAAIMLLQEELQRADMLRKGFPSSSSRSPAFSAAPVRSHHIEKKERGYATRKGC